MNNNYYNPGGMKFFVLPRGKKDHINMKERNISDLGKVTAANTIYSCGLAPDGPLLCCGGKNMAVPFIREFLKLSSEPFVIIGSERDLSNSSCFYSLPWKDEVHAPNEYRRGNTLMKLDAAADPSLALAAYLGLWAGHQVVLCTGGGLLINSEILNTLNRLFTSYIIVCNSFTRSVCVDLQTATLLRYMTYLVCSSFSGSPDEFINILPKYRAEIYTNTTGFSVNRNSGIFGGAQHMMKGKGANISQSRTFEEKSVLEASDLLKLQSSGMSVIYNRNSGCVYTVRIEDIIYKA